MDDDVVIKFDKVTKVYRLYKSDKQRFKGMILRQKVDVKRFKALDNVSFEVRKGESVGILGRNGAGKSTLLKLLTGVTFPTSGDITVKGQVSALLELTAGFDTELTGRENIYLKGYILGLEEKQIKKMEKDIIEFAEIKEFIDQPIRMFSSGMKARLGFAINAVINPDILVIDEALSVGDAVFSAKCRNKVRELIEGGVTVLFVSHNADKIKDFCNRAILLVRGRLTASGTVEEVIEAYKKSVNMTNLNV
jgi:teichoic acid transport system ATP-binding protein